MVRHRRKPGGMHYGTGSARAGPHDIAEGQTAEGKLRLFVAVDRTRAFAFVELHP